MPYTHIPVSSMYKNAKNVMTVQEPRISLTKALETAVRKTKITKTADSVSLSRPKASVVLRESTAVPKEIVEKTIKEFKANEASYDTLRGRINAQADSAGMNINILFSETHPGKLEVQIADRSLPTSRDLLDEATNIFTDIKNAGKHLKTLKAKFNGILNSEKNGGVTTVIVDPKENYAQKIADALLDAIEARDFARLKYKK